MAKSQRTTAAVAAAAHSSARVLAKQSATATDRDIVRRAVPPSRSIEPSAQMQRALMPSTRRPVVLLVHPVRDDGLEMYVEYLRYSGLAAIAVSNAKDALAFAPEADIIVTGMVLDDTVDGVELVSRLRGDDGTMHKPIIVLTACASRRERERAEHAGCDVFLSKPCLPDALLREVRVLLPTTHARLESGAADTGMPRV
jgi:two-component system, cell cycle response regulator DivK